ncbi:L-2-hydroxyglutarate oxidase [Saccharopolyspora cebuensis]|uniref:L-2-hydroxyglutarate oxidase n=1 Tax=Saccharopolyspora cebuensis TaxID=418759 RepID=A0ABV4CBL4_9PSEU
MVDADVVVIGGGIVGLATARAVLRSAPGTSVLVLEAERRWGAHQSGHNSNVIHSGLYYAPGSHKARMARAGAEEMIRFCAEHDVPVRRTGKLVVATRPAEVPRLDALVERGTANGVTVRRISKVELAEREPHVAAVAAAHVAETAVTDFSQVCAAMAAEIAELGGELRTGAPVERIRSRGDGVVLTAGDATVRARALVNCAGLHSDRVARLSGITPPVRIVPFRGEYFALRPERQHLVGGPVYPVPDPALPFLGIHLTPMLDGTVHIGPNAVPAFARHGYRWRDVDGRMLGDLLRDPASRGLARRYWRYGIGEFARSALRPLFVRSVRAMLPEVTARDVLRHGAGVRAQAVDDDGKLVDDFVISRAPRAVHVLNAPSPAATASLLIGERVAADVLDELVAE